MVYSIDIIKKLILKNNTIENCFFLEFPNNKLLQERISLERNSKVVEKALLLREYTKLPFWDSLLLTQFDSNNFTKEIIQEATFHNFDQKLQLVNKQKFEFVVKYILEGKRNFGFNSRVLLGDKTSMHFPLLDFHIPNSNENLPCVVNVLENLNIEGYLFKTNKSFHFLGDTLLTEEGFINFLGRSLLFAPIIDKNWIAHQLVENSSTLRITPKEGNMPHLIKRIKFK